MQWTFKLNVVWISIEIISLDVFLFHFTVKLRPLINQTIKKINIFVKIVLKYEMHFIILFRSQFSTCENRISFKDEIVSFYVEIYLLELLIIFIEVSFDDKSHVTKA
jgi:hypothetical protein